MVVLNKEYLGTKPAELKQFLHEYVHALTILLHILKDISRVVKSNSIIYYACVNDIKDNCLDNMTDISNEGSSFRDKEENVMITGEER